MRHDFIISGVKHTLRHFGPGYSGWHHSVGGDWSTVHGSSASATQALYQFLTAARGGDHLCVGGAGACHRRCGICNRDMQGGRPDDFAYISDSRRDDARKERREKRNDEKNLDFRR